MVYNIECPVLINPLKKHELIKYELLKKINAYNAEPFISYSGNSDNLDAYISRCDWNDAKQDKHRNWVDFFLPHLRIDLLESLKEINHTNYTIQQIWFQQYETDSVHGWHTHSSTWTNVYFLELPYGTPKTQYLDSNNQICEFNVKEGDILTFPSHIIHRAPINTCSRRKTIISWNMNSDINTKILPL